MDFLVHIGLSLLLAAFLDLPKKDFYLFVGANLIDLDHLLSYPVYDLSRDSFQTHLLHQNWLILSVFSLISIAEFAFKEYKWLGAGILFHFLLDYLATYVI